MQKIELHNTIWQFLEKGIKLFGQLITGIIIARLLGPEQFGLLNYIISIVFVFFTLSSFGMENILVNKVVSFPEKTSEFISSAFSIRLLVGAVMFLLLLLFGSFLVEETSIFIMLFLMGFQLFFQPFDVIRIYNQSQLKSKTNTISLNAAFLLAVLLRLYYAFQNNLEMLAFTYSLEIFIQGIILYFFLKKQRNNISLFKPNWSISKSLMKESFPLAFSSLFYLIYVKIDQLMLANLSGYEEVGYYSVAARLSESWYFIPVSIVNSIYPSIVSLKITNKEKYANKVQAVFNLLSGLGFGTALIVSILAFWIISILYGQTYLPVVFILQLHIWNGVLVFGGILAGAWLVNEGLQKLTLYRTIMGAALNIALNLFLIPLYGAVGATIATFFARFFVAFVFYYFFTKSRVLFYMMLKSYVNILNLSSIKQMWFLGKSILKGEKNL
jgi:O-antigen/teichoic acid export membrane protein